MLVEPREFVVEIVSTPAMVANCLMSGVATDVAMMSGEAPGKSADTLITGNSARGRAATGNCCQENNPAIITAADITAQAFTKILNRFESQMRRSMTYDQGSEMRYHKTLTEDTGVTVYFAHPHAPWERGISENTNGLLRQYLPKGTDLSVFSQEQLDDIAWRLNTRPRKTLGWKAPAELFLPQGAFDFVQHWSAKIVPVALGP